MSRKATGPSKLSRQWRYRPGSVWKSITNRSYLTGQSVDSVTPDVVSHLDGAGKLPPLVVGAQLVAMDRGREPTLMTQSELVQRHIFRRLIDSLLDLFGGLDVGKL